MCTQNSAYEDRSPQLCVLWVCSRPALHEHPRWCPATVRASFFSLVGGFAGTGSSFTMYGKAKELSKPSSPGPGEYDVRGGRTFYGEGSGARPSYSFGTRPASAQARSSSPVRKPGFTFCRTSCSNPQNAHRAARAITSRGPCTKHPALAGGSGYILYRRSGVRLAQQALQKS